MSLDDPRMLPKIEFCPYCGRPKDNHQWNCGLYREEDEPAPPPLTSMRGRSENEELKRRLK